MSPLSSQAAVRLVAGREIRTRVASKAFKVTSIAMVLVVVAFVVVAKLISGSDSSSKVGFTPSTEPLMAPFQSIAAAVGEKVTTSRVDEADAERLVRDGDLDAVVTGGPLDQRVIVKDDLPDDLRTVFTVLARQIALDDQIQRAGADPAAVNAAVAAAAFDVQTLEPPRDHQAARILLGIMVGVFVYIAILMYGTTVAQGVVEEKANRIVELLLTTIRPWQLLVGKVLGIGVVGLGQMVLTVGVGVAAGFLTDAYTFPSSIASGLAAWAVVWFLLGYLMYALVFASLGALVSRQEDVGGATAPAIMLIVLPYIAGITILPADPDNELIALLSVIPFFAPMLMPMRIALNVAPAWEIALALGLTVLTIAALAWFAGRVYRNAVLRTGAKIKLFSALRGS
ncbi:ABC transporter permease [Virgisporangium aurantiacum]|uniref:ABC transporter permease n=1 Tax=Virgisporangium aurantiacum TaxID=175570 RepID=A0A8J4DZD7_9ACTN|nr:ABC transporter permease [Virgisporangium aurantiacum]GIJ55423.1 ABC transporter permease [Virgisporangium aurantiacum]